MKDNYVKPFTVTFESTDEDKLGWVIKITDNKYGFSLDECIRFIAAQQDYFRTLNRAKESEYMMKESKKKK